MSQTFTEPNSNIMENAVESRSSSIGSYEQHDAHLHSLVSEHSVNSAEIQKWESIYPGWKYDSIAGQWYQLDGYGSTTNTESYLNMASPKTQKSSEVIVKNAFEGPALEGSVAVDHQKVSHSILETIYEENSSLNNWNQFSQGSINYPHNMVFDPQYPEWYYDTITQAWYTLESYNHTLRDASSEIQDQQTNNSRPAYASDLGKDSMWPEQNGQENNWNTSGGGYDLQSMWPEQIHKQSNGNVSPSECDHQKILQPELLIRNGDVTSFSNNQQTLSYYDSLKYTGGHPDRQLYSNNLEHLFKHNGRIDMTVPQVYATESMNEFTKPNMEQKPSAQLYNSNQGTESSVNYSHQSFYGANPSYSHIPYAPNEARSRDGRPPHALVTFGFGGKVIVMKDARFSSSSFISGSPGTVGGVILIHSLVDIVMDKTNFFNTSTAGGFGYIHTLCQQSFPGPLVGGNAAPKDVNKWIDDRIMSIESSSMDFQNCLTLRLLLSLLKVLCQHYGKLRSPHGIESSHEGGDSPESAVSKLFASAKKSDTPFGGFGSSMHCMKNLPSEENITSTANEVQNLLLSGRKKEALQCAQEGQLWGLALVLAAQFGEEFYGDTVKQMARRQFVCGSPLRTLCLLIAGQPADVFSADSSCGLSADGHYQSSLVLPNTMLDGWQDNLAIITSNRTKDDELVIIHLGDCLWKERGEVTAAHTCYLVAEANLELYSDSARLCLIGVDHMKNPRTYACPDAIQRTEIYEYSKVIGNSQFVLLAFQPYKLVYAYMLAEVGKVSDSLRYCQASIKVLKSSGRSPQLELWRTLFSSLEERLRTHQQGGYGTNLAPTKLVGKLFSSIDRSIHRMIGSPPLPPILQNSGGGRDNTSLSQKVSNSQSTMSISSLMPSSSIETMSEWTVDSGRKVTHNRSVSEPDFGRSAKQDSSKYSGLGNASMPGGLSRFGRFGSQLLQKTVGWVSWSRHDRQAKLGESNKFYYDEKLKRWVEEGAELQTAEASLPPPPTPSFQNGISDSDKNNALNSHSIPADTQPGRKYQRFGFPSMPPSQNQFSAQSRIGVRSRYVDTFNKGGGSFTSSFQSPPAPPVKPLAGASFFVPSTPMNSKNQTNEATFTDELPQTTSSMQRFSSMDDIASSQTLPSESGSLSRARAASWSGVYGDTSNPKAVPMEQHSFVGSHIRSGSGSVTDDLHEVEL